MFTVIDDYTKFRAEIIITLNDYDNKSLDHVDLEHCTDAFTFYYTPRQISEHVYKSILNSVKSQLKIKELLKLKITRAE